MPTAVFARSPTAKPYQGMLRPLKNFFALEKMSAWKHCQGRLRALSGCFPGEKADVQNP